MTTSEIRNRLRDRANALQVRKVADFLLDDPRFPLWSGSSKKGQHHYGTGGLVIHVSEVVELCLLIRQKFYPDVNESILFLSALCHDWGKLWDYEPVGVDSLNQINETTEWRGTMHKRQIHHISRSAIEWQKAVALLNQYVPDLNTPKSRVISEEIEHEVTHAILAHHGERKAGSPVAPNTQVAWLLHLCDGISARMNDWNTLDYMLHRNNEQIP